MPSNHSFTNHRPDAICVLTGAQAQSLTKKEKQLIKVLSKDTGASVTSNGIRTLIQKGEYKKIIDELKAQVHGGGGSLYAVLDYKLIEMIKTL